MRTIPRRYGRPPNGDYRAMCAYCGGAYMRNRMHRTDEGKLCCPEKGCADGRTALGCDRANAQAASRGARPSKPQGW